LDVHPHVDFIGGVTRFPSSIVPTVVPIPYRATPVNPQYARVAMQLYVEATNATNSQAIVGFFNESISQKDVLSFQARNSLPPVGVKVIGKIDESAPTLSATASLEFLLGVGVRVPTSYLFFPAEHAGQEPFLNWILNVSSDPNSPYVQAVLYDSYTDYESSFSEQYKARVDVEFQKYGVTGRSILFSSGEIGTGCNAECTRFRPLWPATSPYITSVGGAYNHPYDNYTVDSADPSSGGGFSDFYPRPAYQNGAVINYLKGRGIPPITFFNPNGRGYPDIAAYSAAMEVVINNKTQQVDSISAAAASAAGVFSLLNDVRLNAGKPTLGFLNPFLYQAGSKAFRDLDDAENNNNNKAGCCPQGFYTASYWSPITGLGVPYYSVLKTLL